MGEVRGLFQRLFNSFEAFLSEAQAAGQVEKYLMEVVVGKQELGAVPRSTLYAALVSLLHTLQEVLENCCTEKKQNLLSSVTCSLVPEQYEQGEDYVPELATSGSSKEKDRGKAPETHPQPLHCLSPPLQPTTKETEAANVLMNLSGKATDRGAQPMLESQPTPLHSHHSATKAPLYSCSPITPARKDLGSRKEPVPCDEVPQINEKDLLPLAIQVLCQFCSRQCEDLVELHEHVLAAHHAAEGEATLSVPQRKGWVSLREEEDASGVAFIEEQEQRQELADSGTAMIVLFQEPCTSHSSVEKKKKKKGKLKRGTNALGKESLTSDESPHEEKDCMEDWHSTVVGSGLEVHQSQSDLPSSTLPCNNLCDKDQEWLKGQAGRSVTELTPVGSGDTLAMAVESSQIRLIETKVTILVCLECSSGFTDPQEHGGHACAANRPLVYRGSDGSVSLADLSSGNPAQHMQASDMRLFPEFSIQQTVEDGAQGLQVVHLSGLTLRLHTSCPLSYLGDQLISFRLGM